MAQPLRVTISDDTNITALKVYYFSNEDSIKVHQNRLSRRLHGRVLLKRKGPGRPPKWVESETALSGHVEQGTGAIVHPASFI